MAYMIDLVNILNNLNKDLYNESNFAKIDFILIIKLLVKINCFLLKYSIFIF